MAYGNICLRYDAMTAKFKMQYFCTCLLDDIPSLQIINELANYVNKEAFYYIWTYSTDKNVPVQVK